MAATLFQIFHNFYAHFTNCTIVKKMGLKSKIMKYPRIGLSKAFQGCSGLEHSVSHMSLPHCQEPVDVCSLLIRL